jgi:uncharacterized protein (DUF1330 family)
MLVEITVKNAEMYEQYMNQIPAVIGKYGGRYIIRSSKVLPGSGGWAPDRIILVEFNDLASLRACFRSEEYAQLAPLREQATVTRSVVIEQ